MIIGNFIVTLLNLYTLLIIIRAVVSWVGMGRENQFVRVLYAVTDPILEPIQSVIPPIGGTIDISPIIAIFFVQLLREVVTRIFW